MSQPHYFVASYNVTDGEAYQTYVQQVIPLLQKHNGEVLVADYEAKPLEGSPNTVMIVLRFPDEQTANAWYNDPAYEPVKKIRLDSTANGAAVFGKQFVMPTQ